MLRRPGIFANLSKIGGLPKNRAPRQPINIAKDRGKVNCHQGDPAGLSAWRSRLTPPGKCRIF